jgi:hypothetical protein
MNKGRRERGRRTSNIILQPLCELTYIRPEMCRLGIRLYRLIVFMESGSSSRYWRRIRQMGEIHSDWYSSRKGSSMWGLNWRRSVLQWWRWALSWRWWLIQCHGLNSRLWWRR